MKRMKLAAAVAAALLAGAPALAGVQDFTIVNNTGYQIDRVNVSASTTDDWEEDVLGSEVLTDGERARIHFQSDAEGCLWDIKVTYEDGETAAWQGVDLCEVSVIALHYDDEEGRTWADTE